MKYRKVILAIASMLAMASVSAQPAQPQRGKRVEAQRKYSLIVHEGNDSVVKELNRGLASARGNRGILQDLGAAYRSTFSGHVTGAATALVDFGFNAIINATQSKQPKWEQAVRGESSFVRVLPMQMEILDFYRSPSTTGPLDPTDLLFNGFGCRQVIEYQAPDGTVSDQEVFYISCSVRTDSLGRMRMLNHSKFEVYVDSLRFDYSLCDLPNDSLGVNTDSRIGFDFAKRSNLTFNVAATIKSSWITQAMQVYTDEPLGTFNVRASIDPGQLDADGVFTYSAARDAGGPKRVSVSGDCFLVPRSYVGSTDMATAEDSWGTGQYKVEMRISETCTINADYYKTDGKWDKKLWGPEWELISKRRPQKSVWRQILDVVGTQYAGTQWVTTLVEPAKTVVVTYEKGALTKLINGASGAMPTGMPASASKTPSAGSSGAPQGAAPSGAGNGGNPKR